MFYSYVATLKLLSLLHLPRPTFTIELENNRRLSGSRTTEYFTAFVIIMNESGYITLLNSILPYKNMRARPAEDINSNGEAQP